MRFTPDPDQQPQPEQIDRNTAREAFKQSGLTYDVVTRENLQRLRNIINKKMIEGGFIRGSFRCRQRAFMQATRRGLYAGIKCNAFYFKDREAVSFNPDGFIGFAGWADDTNIKPIVDGFIDWVKEISKNK